MPDVLDHTQKVIGEVKNVPGKIPLTAQLRDSIAYAQAKGYRLELYVPKGASFTRPLQKLVDSGVVIPVPF